MARFFFLSVDEVCINVIQPLLNRADRGKRTSLVNVSQYGCITNDAAYPTMQGIHFHCSWDGLSHRFKGDISAVPF